VILRLRARARADLDAILDHSVDAHGEEAAEAYLRRIDAVFGRLRDHPDIGVERADLAADLRSYPVGEHRIYYLRLADRISIVRVLHKAMESQRHI